MKTEYLLSLRLGFTTKYADLLTKKGTKYYIQYLLDHPVKAHALGFIPGLQETIEARKMNKQLSKEEKKKQNDEERKRFHRMQAWWLGRMYTAENPLQERMTLFWHNHFVSSFQKVKSTSFLFAQNNTFRENSFGSFKELTREILYDNAMLIYLDNNDNKVGKPNENLSRELLELFTIGIGNYTEQDIKEGARALAGLAPGPNGGMYRPKKEDFGVKTYMGKKGNLIADDLVVAIFNNPKVTLRITEKLLKYFLTDSPDSKLTEKYAEYLEKNNFKIEKVLEKLFLEEDFNNYSGAKIKDPLTFTLQTFCELNVKTVPYRPTLKFLKSQGMELFNPPNVKGWDGGKSWLDSGKLIARNSAINTIFNQKFVKNNPAMMVEEDGIKEEDTTFIPTVEWDKNSASNKEVISDLSGKMLFNVDSDMENNMERLLKYDFEPNVPGSDEAVTQLVKYIMKSPEYQLL